MLSSSLAISFFGYAIFCIVLVLISSCLVLYWAPAAAGGGVTLVMAYLNGNDIPDLLRFRTLITKIVGTICTITSSLPLGQEGPMVHIGAAIASTLTWMHGEFPNQKKYKDKRSCCHKLHPQAWPFDFHNDKDRREFISAGTAAGLAAAFGSPVGGVLYSLEEASSFWSRKVMWRSLVCTAVATMLLSWLHEGEFSFVLPGSLSFHGLQPVFHLQDLPLFLITSVAAGILGAFINTSHGWLARVRPPSAHAISRIVEACSVTLISAAVIFIVPYFFGQCLPVPEIKADEEFWFAYTCPGQDSTSGVNMYNDLATLLFSVPHETIKHLLQLGNDVDPYFTVRSLGIYTVSFLAIFILAYGIATPGGIFMPSMMVGASVGALLGCLFRLIFPGANIQPGLHALIGATALLGGVFRSSISVVVIMVEGTASLDFILPVIMAVVVSNWVAHHIHQHGAYEADLQQLGHVHFLQSEPPRELIPLTAFNIMSPHVVGFEEIVPVTDVLKVLRSTRHNGFPVFKSSYLHSDDAQGKMAGLILRHQLLLLLEQHAFVEVDLAAIKDSDKWQFPYFGNMDAKQLQVLESGMRAYHFCHHPHRRDLTSRPEAIDEIDLVGILDSQIEYSDATIKGGTIVDTTERPRMTLVLDLRPFMNRVPLTVRGECSAQRVYVIFRTLGLRHLCVTDSNGRVVGMITRKDLGLASRKSTVSTSRWSTTLLRWDSDPSLDERTSRDILYSLP
ncbi:uncharacterized protein LOC131060938 isoform X2 [Cryptomeria japonica]|nr:uncharacterized protein LOC131060938 isoform X2 [Cryptomeria japonica]XP_057850378.1 uncharacterized protein LOC131060938 isoform X2 [Cryptomeria japonica]XP_057850379.1 uncharacterized protein LOC131060938 isoform X2 [Cryptomeria japonica]XP_059077488.1 uncharacterized protein LOC131060938 isoform X2 [Cryptomeria japonica]